MLCYRLFTHLEDGGVCWQSCSCETLILLWLDREEKLSNHCSVSKYTHPPPEVTSRYLRVVWLWVLSVVCMCVCAGMQTHTHRHTMALWSRLMSCNCWFSFSRQRALASLTLSLPVVHTNTHTRGRLQVLTGHFNAF